MVSIKQIAVLAAAAFMPAAGAAVAQSKPAYSISSLHLLSPGGLDTSDPRMLLSFTQGDSTQYTVCDTTWKRGEAPPLEPQFQRCLTGQYVWAFRTFQSVSNFTLLVGVQGSDFTNFGSTDALISNQGLVQYDCRDQGLCIAFNTKPIPAYIR